eukprot:1746296-Pyramimonas_sp.AAC.1
MRTFRLKCEDPSVVVGFDVHVLSDRIALSPHFPNGDRTLQRPRCQSWDSNWPLVEKAGGCPGAHCHRCLQANAGRHVASLLLELASLHYPWQVIERAVAL